MMSFTCSQVLQIPNFGDCLCQDPLLVNICCRVRQSDKELICMADETG
jgi:hypothetical protein